MPEMTVRDELPERRGDLEVAEFHTEYVVYDERCREVHRIVGLAAVVFDACDGRTRSGELIAEVAGALDVSHQEASDLVESVLGELARTGLLAGSEDERPPP